MHIHVLRDFSWHTIILLVFTSHQNNMKSQTWLYFQRKVNTVLTKDGNTDKTIDHLKRN